MNTPSVPSLEPIDEADLVRRRAASRKLAWVLGALVITLYVTGFFIQR